MKRILMICTGNICRSPIAEVVGREKFADLGLEFCSAGLSPVPGHGASQGSREYVDEEGLSLDNHASRGVTAEDLQEAAWVIGMTRSHAALFRSRFGQDFQGKVGVLGAPGLDLKAQSFSPAIEEVDDPYGMSRERYFETGRQIWRLLEAWGPEFRRVSDTEES